MNLQKYSWMIDATGSILLTDWNSYIADFQDGKLYYSDGDKYFSNQEEFVKFVNEDIKKVEVELGDKSKHIWVEKDEKFFLNFSKFCYFIEKDNDPKNKEIAFSVIFHSFCEDFKFEVNFAEDLEEAKHQTNKIIEGFRRDVFKYILESEKP
ncbi:MAG: hypothetical protein EKK64_01775 [Neisseriaceae bacterium]|nr:MAG: hypothetical protein EKK64_01775 [Neisseriaceae bacterium]